MLFKKVLHQSIKICQLLSWLCLKNTIRNDDLKGRIQIRTKSFRIHNTEEKTIKFVLIRRHPQHWNKAFIWWSYRRLAIIRPLFYLLNVVVQGSDVQNGGTGQLLRLHWLWTYRRASYIITHIMFCNELCSPQPPLPPPILPELKERTWILCWLWGWWVYPMKFN